VFSRDRREPRRTADAGHHLCHQCGGDRFCIRCDGFRWQEDGTRCSSCDYGYCLECDGDGQIAD
jgi:hypothetical protein